MYYPSLEEFSCLAQQGNLIPVYREVIVDMETPISLYQKICSSESYTYLLESVEGGERMARYSFIGESPFLIFRGKGDQVEIIKQGKKEVRKGNPLEILKETVQSYQAVSLPQLPRFQGGAVGYFSYDTVRLIEDLPNQKADDLELPDLFFIFTDLILIFDHLQHTLKIVANILLEDQPYEEAYQSGIEKIEKILRKMEKRAVFSGYFTSSPPLENYPLKSNFTRAEFEESVRKAKEYIRAGDIFQVGLSQRFQVEIKVDPFEIYRSLRRINPSPYMYYLNYGDLKLVGTSPELLIRVEDGTAITRPIAGTRPRGKTPEEDQALAVELLEDEKERAEHIMLVDLHRNDLGRVCKYGTVEVDELMIIERYSHVMHIVSNIKGELTSDYDAFQALEASFPAGTVSGAPKIRAMEIIEELEPNRRGPYAGAVGYLSFNGNLDTCITIRTIVVKGNQAYVQAGAGIVADSNPALEYEETVNKAGALLKAIYLAQGDQGEFLKEKRCQIG